MAASIDPALCNVIYVDRRARQDRLVERSAVAPSSPSDSLASLHLDLPGESSEVVANLRALLSTFNQVHLCRSGSTCRAKAADLDQRPNSELNPTLVLMDIPPEEDEHLHRRAPNGAPLSSDTTHFVFPSSPDVEDFSFYGLRLLRCIALETNWQSLSRLFVPIAVVFDRHSPSSTTSTTALSPESLSATDTDGPAQWPNGSGADAAPEAGQMLRYLDAGAADVIATPFDRRRVAGLVSHAYRAHKEAVQEQKDFLAVKKVRKRSWVGVDDTKPYAYLREAMVSGLMDGICKPQPASDPVKTTYLSIAHDRRAKAARAIGRWDFSAHDFSDDELLYAASLMLQHALTMPDLEPWRLTTDKMTAFLIATRTAYNSFVPYHNFRHVVDVLQAVFYFLLQLGSLPPYPAHLSPPASATGPLASLLRPFDALTLLITAVGHDVGHPGVNNAFLVTLNAPLAQLYNDRSVLESFHCAAFSQILRRHWPAAFQSADMRKLLINSILATDMGLHFDYMKKLGLLQERLSRDGPGPLMDAKVVEEQRTLLCSLLIKCADISNVARPHEIAAQWAGVLTDEFARQASMENDLGIPSALFAAPVRDSVVALGKSQIGFMALFALPLFQGVAGIMPTMKFSVEEMLSNKESWESKIDHESRKASLPSLDTGAATAESLSSPAAKSISSSGSTRPSSELGPESPPRATVKPLPAGKDLGKASRESSLSTANHVPAADRIEGKRTSTSSSGYGGPLVDMASRNSSGVLPAGNHPTLSARRSSNAVPTQLQLEMAASERRRSSVDHSLVAVLVTSAGRRSKSSDPRSARRANGNSSEKSSAPSSNEWQSTLTSPVNAACSPTTEGTSFFGQDSPDRSEFDTTLWSPPADEPKEQSEKAANGSRHDGGKTVRHRSSRWRLGFWKSKRKTTMEAVGSRGEAAAVRPLEG